VLFLVGSALSGMAHSRTEPHHQSITADLYGHVSPVVSRRAATAIADLVGAAGEQPLARREHEDGHALPIVWLTPVAVR
jgi:hypothetical protein